MDWITGDYTFCRCAQQCSRHRLSRSSKVLSVCLSAFCESRVGKQASAGTLWFPLVTVFMPRLKHTDDGVHCSNRVNSKHFY